MFVCLPSPVYIKKCVWFSYSLDSCQIFIFYSLVKSEILWGRYSMFDVYHEVDNFDSERMVDSMINIVERIKSQKTWNSPLSLFRFKSRVSNRNSVARNCSRIARN